MDIEQPQVVQQPQVANTTVNILNEELLNIDIQNDYTFFDQDLLTQYKLNPDLLKNSGIEKKQRNKLRNWIIVSCSSLQLPKATCSMALYLVDLSIQKGFTCPKENLHLLSQSCLILAQKFFDQNKKVSINYGQITSDEIQNQKQIALEFQQMILVKLSFRISPITHVEISQSLFDLWGQFIQAIKIGAIGQRPQIEMETKVNCAEIKFSLVLLNELLALVFYILKSHRIDLDILVFNAFYLILAIQYQQIRGYLELRYINRQFYNRRNPLLSFVKSFGGFCLYRRFNIRAILRAEVGQYLGKFYNSLIAQEDHSENRNTTQNFFDPNHVRWHNFNQNDCQTNIFDKYPSYLRYLDRYDSQRRN